MAQSVLDPNTWMAAEAPWPPGVQAGITLRAGGVSGPPWDSWNLGDHVGDDPVHVHVNRQRLSHHIGAHPVFCQQVHGIDVLDLGAQTPDGVVADGAWIHEAGLACTMMVADCLPLLIALPDGGGVAALHAGWRGLCGQQGIGIIESLVRWWPALADPGTRASAVVWLGPCIGPQAFEVGPEVRAAFMAHDAGAFTCFRPVERAQEGAKWWADLQALARQRLSAAGFQQVHGNDGAAAWCTYSHPSRFFSHRRDHVRHGSTGRMAACIWRQPI